MSVKQILKLQIDLYLSFLFILFFYLSAETIIAF